MTTGLTDDPDGANFIAGSRTDTGRLRCFAHAITQTIFFRRSLLLCYMHLLG